MRIHCIVIAHAGLNRSGATCGIVSALDAAGLNHCLNLGHGIWHSGTIAAAKQATMLGIHGIALASPRASSRCPIDAMRRHPWDIGRPVANRCDDIEWLADDRSTSGATT